MLHMQLYTYLKTRDSPEDNTPHCVDTVAPQMTGKEVEFIKFEDNV